MTQVFHSLSESIEALLAKTGPRVVLGIPLGIGKPNAWVNALYLRIKDDSRFHLHIITALSLEKPCAHSDLEARFLGPFVERVFGDYPDLDYVKDLKSNRLPGHITVSEFFLKTGDYLHNAHAQQHYISANYTHVARSMLDLGVNVLAQEVAVKEEHGHIRYSLGSNPDVLPDALDFLIETGKRRDISVVGVVNRLMPFMPHDAEIEVGHLDLLVECAEGTHTLFGPPNMKVSVQDYAIGLHASTLVRDGGTLQIGIGSLGDAIAQALILRDRQNHDYRDMVGALYHQQIPAGAQLQPFATGLYGCSEMFVNGFMQLIQAGILRRKVYSDVRLQRLFNTGELETQISLGTLTALIEEGLVSFPLDSVDLAWLHHYGVLLPCVQLNDDDRLLINGKPCANLLENAETRALLMDEGLGDTFQGGIYMHGGFFLGPQSFYQTLRDMDPAALDGICMSRISFINQLYGQEALARAQRRAASFMNTTMMITLLGAAVSDGLEDGQLVSGVGGQYNFVAMAHALPDAQSVLMLRAVREAATGPTSNIVWNYGHTTIPRHLRDIVITEYGMARLRGQPDNEIIKRLLCITDSRFQYDLMQAAKEAGKLEADWQIPDAASNNLPENLCQALKPWQDKAQLPDFPFGTDFTADELSLIRALTRLKSGTDHPLDLLKSLIQSFVSEKEVPERYLERLHLENPDSLKLRLLRQLIVGNL